MDITKRLSVEVDGDGDYELTIVSGGETSSEYTFLSQAEADRLIVALGGTPGKFAPAGNGTYRKFTGR